MTTLGWIAALLGCMAIFDDLRRRAIANWITLAGFAGGLFCYGWKDGISGLLWSASGAAVGFALFLVLYWLRAMGAGDLKLMAAFGALLGPSGVLLAALLAAPMGAAIAAGWLAWKPWTRTIPYAPAIALGAWLALLGRG